MSTIVVLAKAPTAGRVKTRLCPPCTPAEAAAIAEASLVDTLRAVAQVHADRRVVVLDGDVGPWSTVGALAFEVVPQRSGGLDVRLADAFDDVLAPARGNRGPGPASIDEPCVLIAMDTPHVDPAALDRAVSSLVDADAVLGLAEDGGFWLIGLREPNRRAFTGVPMSIAATGELQRARLVSLGYRVVLTDPMRDVDTAADLDWLAVGYPNLLTSLAWRRQGR